MSDEEYLALIFRAYLPDGPLEDELASEPDALDALRDVFDPAKLSPKFEAPSATLPRLVRASCGFLVHGENVVYARSCVSSNAHRFEFAFETSGSLRLRRHVSRAVVKKVKIVLTRRHGSSSYN